MITQKGFLLSFIKYGDSDAILHIFSYEAGFQSFFSRGVFNSKSKKKSLLLPLNELIIHSKLVSSNGKMMNITSLETLSTKGFHHDVRKQTILFFVAEFLHEILKNENQSPEIYHEIEFFLEQLEKGNYSSHHHLLIRLLKILGHAPLSSEKEYLNPESGNFESFKSHPVFDEEISSFWKKFLLPELDYQQRPPKELKKDFLDSILVYYQFHVAGFRKPKSLEIVREIFEN